jgi:hypothetical protein
MLVLIDASGSMTASRDNSDGNGANRFEAAKSLSRRRVLEQADPDQSLVVAVYTFHDDVLLRRYTGTDVDAFVDVNTARNAIRNLGDADIGTNTPLAGALCVAGDTLHVPETTDVEILQVSSDGEENATPGTHSCWGTPGTCNLATMECTPPESWQARVLGHLTGTSAAIVKVDLFNTAPIVGATLPLSIPDPERILDSQTRMRALTASSSTALTPLQEFFTVLTRATGGTLNIIHDDEPLPVSGDLSGDRCVDRADAILVARQFGPLMLPADGKYDLNLDRTVDFADYLLQASRITPTCGPDPYVPRVPVVCDAPRQIVIDGQSIESGAITIDVRSACQIVIKNSLIVSGQNAITIVGSAVVKVDNSIIVGQNALLGTRGTIILSAANSVFHGRLSTNGALNYIDRGGNIFE